VHIHITTNIDILKAVSMSSSSNDLRRRDSDLQGILLLFSLQILQEILIALHIILLPFDSNEFKNMIEKLDEDKYRILGILYKGHEDNLKELLQDKFPDDMQQKRHDKRWVKRFMVLKKIMKKSLPF